MKEIFRILSLLVVVVVAIFCGCSQGGMKFTRGNGDVGRFILRQALVRGARPVATNNLPSIEGRWRYAEDENGVVVQFPRDRFGEIESFLRYTFGSPAQEPTDTTDGGKLGWYAARSIGVGLQFGYDRAHAQVIVLRPLASSEILKHIPEALERKK